MRRTGSRVSRERRDASATSPTSIAVKTFSIRLGSRRIQRPSHQKIRSITTVSATKDRRRIGYMIGPPSLKLRTKKFLSSSLWGLADGLGDPFGDAEAVVVVVVVAGDIPGTVAETIGFTVAPGAAGAVVVPGAVAGLIAVAGLVAGAGAVVVVFAGAVAGLVAGAGAVPGGFGG